MKYTIQYYFDGNGTVEIEANTEEEAREMFFEGNFTQENEWGENFNIASINQHN